MSGNIVQKLWNYCNVLRDDGMSYGDYVEAAPAHPCARGIRTSCPAQLTYLLFLKMADERTQAPYHQSSIAPQRFSWSSVIRRDGDELPYQFSGSRYPALAGKPSPRFLPRAFGGTEFHWSSFFSRRARHAVDALGKEKGKGLLGLT